MKKRIMALLLTGCMLSLSACNVNINLNSKDKDPAESASAEETDDINDTDDEKVEEIKPDANGVLSNGLFSVTMPKDTEGLYTAIATKNGIVICDKEARDGGFGGFVFSVQAYEDPEDYAGGLDIKIGEIHSGDKILDVTITQPTEVEWDYEKHPDEPESYGTLSASMDEIVNSLKPDTGGEYVAGAGTKGEELYGDVIAQFKTALSEGWNAKKLEKNDMSSMYYAITQYDGVDEAAKVTGYAYADVNADGIDELVVGEIADGDWKGVIYDIYTMVDRKPAHVVSGYTRDRYFAVKGGLIVNEASGGAELTEIVSYFLEPNSTEMIPQLGVKYDSYDDKANPWYVSFSIEEGKWDKITEEEYEEYLGRINEYIRFDYTPFAP